MHHAMPILVAVLCFMAIAYRYYSVFLASKVAALDDSRTTPAVLRDDGHNYHPTSKWVLFGHHFAAISGAGPLIGPVLAAQFGYLPGLLWIVIGVCLGGAVQDFLVLSASIRRGGKSLAQIAHDDIGRTAGWAAMLAILIIIVVALAGLGKVVVKALGGEEVRYPIGSRLVLPAGTGPVEVPGTAGKDYVDYRVPCGAKLIWNDGRSEMPFTDAFTFRWRGPGATKMLKTDWSHDGLPITIDTTRIVPGSSWGTFTIACTIPIALFVGWYIYRLRKGKVVEASLVGGTLTLVAVFVGGWIAQHRLGAYFNLTGSQVVTAMAIYGFVAAVLPVWVLLAPRDYLSSFLKIGTIALLVGGTLLANPQLKAEPLNHIFFGGGPVVSSGSPAGIGGRPIVAGTIFPFLFITIMCGAISGFHALVSSGTTPKMIMKESQARTIGYGAMLMEGLVAVVAMIAAASLDRGDYYAMNTDMANVPAWQDSFARIGADVDHLNAYDALTQESLRGRTGGAVTLAVGMAHIFDSASGKFWHGLGAMWKYWYHFAIMFEALFILTTIDAGTRIGRFLLQELAGRLHPKLADTSWWPGAIISTLLIVAGWSHFINANSFPAIWSMFGVGNQMLAVIALAIISAYLVNEGKRRYLWVTVIPLGVVTLTTTTAALELLVGHWATVATQLHKTTPNATLLANSLISGGLILAMLGCAYVVIFTAAVRCGRGAKLRVGR